MKTIKYTQAKKLLYKLIQTKYPNLYQNIERDAILTHWLQNPVIAHTAISETLYDEFVNEIENKYSNDNMIEELQSAYQIKFDFAMDNIPFPLLKNSDFTFIDLFAGIGGFRIAMQNLGGECVFSSEWDKYAKQTYEMNFGEVPYGDITKIDVTNIPKHDVLCAGFPCQPFSKGGNQNGLEDTRGTLFFDVCKIVKEHKPNFIFLENVSNLVSHDKGNTYRIIKESLDELGYVYPEKPLVLSPDKFGMPIIRQRVYIPCIKKELVKDNIDFIQNINDEIKNKEIVKIQNIDNFLNKRIKRNTVSTYEKDVIAMWGEFYNGVDLKVIGFPVWVDFFKFDEDLTQFPDWKRKFIEKNISLYKRNKNFIDKWLDKYDNLNWCNKTHKKMEWQAGSDYDSIYDCLIQFRPSGVRVKRPNKFSTLVAMNHQQIIGKYMRKVSIEEAKLLQSFPKEYKLPNKNSIAMKQLGNTVNINMIEMIFKIIQKHFI